MINLLPPSLKEQKKYAIYNIQILIYVGLVLLTSVAVVLALVVASWFAGQDLTNQKKNLATLEKKANDTSEILEEAKVVDQQIKVAEQLLDNESNFTVLFNDLASVLPEGTRLQRIKLDGDDSMPMKAEFQVTDRDLVPKLQSSLVSSDRFTHADVQSITEAGDLYNISMVLRFAKGAAR